MTKRIAATIAALALPFALAAAWASTAAAAPSKPHASVSVILGNDTFCVHSDGGKPHTLYHSNRYLLAIYLKTHKGSTFVGQGECQTEEQPPPVDPTPGFICTDNGTTIPVPDLAAALAEFPDATSGACVTVIPEPVPVPEAADLTHEYLVCWSHSQDDPDHATIEQFTFRATTVDPESGKFFWVNAFLPSVNTTPNASPIGNGLYPHCNDTGPITGHVTQNGDPVNDGDWPHITAQWGKGPGTDGVPFGFFATRAK